MSLQRLWSGVVLAVTLAVPTAGFAQGTAGTGATPIGTGGIFVRVASVNGEDNREAGQVYLGIEACRNDWPVVYSLDSVPNNRTSIDIYRGESCNGPNRNSTTGDGCEFVDNLSIRQTLQLELSIPASKLFRNGCDTRSQSTPNLWFLPVNDSQSAETVTVYGRSTEIVTDAEAPYAPSGVSADGGERTIAVHWTSDDQAKNLDRFLIYVDPDPGSAVAPEPTESDADGGTSTTPSVGASNLQCPSRALIAGATPPASPPDGILVKTVTNEGSDSYNLSPEELGLGDEPAAIAMVAVDRAGNYSPFSAVVCASAVPTQDFWEAYQADGGGDVEGCPCATMGRTQLQGGLPVAFALLMLAFSARKRRAP